MIRTPLALKYLLIPIIGMSLAFPLDAGRGDVTEDVEVSRVIVNVRALDNGGNPIPDLTPEDFRVLVEGERARVESVEWVTGATPTPAEVPTGDPPVREGGREPGVPGRLIVFFFQRDLLDVRVVGLMHMVREARLFLDTLGPRDRVAILKYDYHLDLYSDFTDDAERLRSILQGTLLPPERAYAAPEGEPLSLVRHLDMDAAYEATTPETGILVTARALEEIPGAKTLLYFGWGLGRMTGGGARMQPDYGEMRQALIESGTTLFTLDYTQSDIHGLEGPLMTAAWETGGKYVKAYQFSIRAMKSVARAIAGHYELTFVKPDLPRGRHPIKIKLPGRRGWVYHQSHYDG
jgi:VWFA-related protein